MGSRRRPSWARGGAVCQPHGGFTLIEVLVVVAIIALLVAILIPSLAAARAQARRGVCSSNLHQIATAWQVYLDSNAGRFFQCVNANYNYGGRQGNGDTQFGKDPDQPVPKPLNRLLRLDPILRNGGEVFFCPADTGGDVEKPTVFNYYGTSYATNQFLIGQTELNIVSGDPFALLMLQMSPLLKDLNRSDVFGESRVLLLGDFGWVHTYNFMSPLEIYWHRRRDTHNLAFLDGHVDFVHIRKGVHVTSQYTTIPFRQFQERFAVRQKELAP